MKTNTLYNIFDTDCIFMVSYSKINVYRTSNFKYFTEIQRVQKLKVRITVLSFYYSKTALAIKKKNRFLHRYDINN